MISFQAQASRDISLPPQALFTIPGLETKGTIPDRFLKRRTAVQTTFLQTKGMKHEKQHHYQYNRKTQYIEPSDYTTGTPLVTAITCILAPLSIPIPVSPVPISLTNLVLLISVYVLGWKDAAVSYIVYLLLGAAGLPVFSGFAGGPAKIAGPTGGYLLGFIFMTILAGIFVERFLENRFLIVTGMILATVIAYIFGTAWLAFQMDLSFTAALSIGVLPYLPGDTAKIVLAVLTGPVLKSRLKNIR